MLNLKDQIAAEKRTARIKRRIRWVALAVWAVLFVWSLVHAFEQASASMRRADAMFDRPMRVALSIEQIQRNLRPSDIDMPPLMFRSEEGPIRLIFKRDPRVSCRQNDGMITPACTLGRSPNPVVTVMPEPCGFREPFAQKVCAAPMADRPELFRWACLYDNEVYARLGCHEVIGHQLGRWPGTHPRDKGY